MSGLEDELNSLIEMGSRAVKLALKLGADEADVYITRDVTTSIEIENGSVNFSDQSTDIGFGLRVLKAGRLGFSYCTSEKEMEETFKSAIGVSRFSRKVKFNLPEAYPRSSIPKIAGLFDPKVLDLEAQSGLDMSQILLDAASEVHKDIHISGGGVGFGYDIVAIVNSNGLEAGYFGTGYGASMSTVIQADSDDVAGQGFEAKSSRSKDIDLSEIGRTASELAIKSLNPQQIEGGELSVVFHPFAFSGLLEFTILPSLYGEEAHKGESVYSGKLGEKIAGDNISIVDDSTVANAIGSEPVDDEGMISRKTVLIEKGELKGYIYDIASAAEFEQEPTANGMRAERWDTSSNYHAMPETSARNIYLECEVKKLDDLIADIKSGIYVYSVMGAHTANTVSGDFSVNSPTLFKIENGEIGYPCKPIMLSGNMPELMHNIVGMADDMRMVDGEFHPSSMNFGSVRIDKMKVTS